MKTMKNLIPKLALVISILGVSSSGIAQDKSIAHEYFEGDTLSFEYKGNFTNATISVMGPERFKAKVFKKFGLPSITLSKYTPFVSDGIYHYQITAASNIKIEADKSENNGRDSKSSKRLINVGASQTGSFSVRDGYIVTNTDIKEEK